MRRIAVTVSMLLVLVALATAQDRAATLILISLDGFRWDYTGPDGGLPNIRRLAARGVRAEALVPSFPSKTFPNHHTIVTGLYPSRHGIVSNTLRDPRTGRTGSLTRREHAQDSRWWNGVEPLWVTLERRGRITGAMFWPGTEAAINGTYPRHWTPFDDTYPAQSRLDRVLAWMDLPAAQRPHFITLYFSDVDVAGHDYGPDSPQLRAAVARVDGYVGTLLAGLEQRGLAERTNIVVLADHGMAPASTERAIVIEDYVTLLDGELVEINPTLSIAPGPGRTEMLYAALARAHPRLHVYRRERTPPHWRYRDHPRIPAIVGVVDEGWSVLRRATLETRRTAARGGRGEHGYDPATSPTMGALFVAAGPAFRQGVTVPRFENVHVYNALATALGIKPNKNDGDMAIARRLLR